tara:strand:+ start:330 stop:938 length:609 start_codon:yes stop_codon:yes gene_type:complete
MSRTQSTMLPLGTILPIFELKDISSCFKEKEQQSNFLSTSLDSKPILIMLICTHCPFVKLLESEISKLEKDFKEYIQFIAVSSNSLKTHPQDAPEFMENQYKSNQWTFPYLFDEEQSLAKELRAACTPEFYLFDYFSNNNHQLVYRGQFDESRPGNNITPSGLDVRNAINCVLSDKAPSADQKPSIGCNIKWHPGEEPNWFV